MTRTEASPLFDRVTAWSIDHPLPGYVRYAIATVLILLVAGGRALFVTSLLPWLLFVPVILAIALVLAEDAGLYASMLATVLAAAAIGDRAEPFWLTGPQWTASLLFLGVAIVVTRMAGDVRAGLRRTRLLNRELAEREAFLSSVLSSSTDCIKVLDMNGRLTFMSDGGQQVMEVEDFNAIRGANWADFWTEDDGARAAQAVEAARRGDSTHFVGKADTMLGKSRWWGVSVSPIFARDGTTERILSVSRDLSDLIAAQEQQRLLNGELSHRLKNVLALVQSIANQTFRQADSLASANIAFAARLVALAKATDVLTATAWRKATLHDVVEAGLTSIDGLRDRVTLDGPAIELAPQVAMALTLSLHELTTNACKYGALSNETGTIVLKWDHGHGPDGLNDRFTFMWQESGGPTVVMPTHRGFGSRMIERSLRSYFRGDTSLEYAPTGVVFRIDAPMPQAEAILGE